MALDTTGFEDGFHGTAYREGDAGYHEACTVWNGMIDSRPALIARVTGVTDVRHAIRFAAERALPVAIRGGGHNVAGHAVAADSLVVDCSELRAVRVDPETRTAWVQGGATLADVDRETTPFGLAAPLGVVSETGVAGLTLGGGIGHLRREYGLSCDNLRTVEVVTADGEYRRVSPDEHTELFWALRGGGGNFGVATGFTFDLHPVGPKVATALVFHGGSRECVIDAIRGAVDYAADAPRAVSLLLFCGRIPDGEEGFPPSSYGDPFVGLMACHAGPVETGERELAAIRELDDPIVDFSGTAPYAEFQRALDEDYPDGKRYYWKSLDLPGVDNETIEDVVDTAIEAPSPLSTVDLWHLGGAIADVEADATAYDGRDAEWLLGVEANWTEAADDDLNVAWVRKTIGTFRERAGGSYVNFPGFGEESTASVYGVNHDRLRAVKGRYDPENLFRHNQNLEPAI